MVTEMTRDQTLAHAAALARTQPGGTLATVHAEDATPYVTYVLFHLRGDGKVLFGSAVQPQHARNIQATPEVSFLIDNREVVRDDWTAFDRVVIEGRAIRIAAEDPEYRIYLDELGEKNKMAAYFTEQGQLFCIQPRRILVMRGFEPVRNTVEFEDAEPGR
jgi:nitroimidazol reductase NimA-like FMN-containing flavoprotein (pyridoxamine 5'-phosphate oxidase superfamily)